MLNTATTYQNSWYNGVIRESKGTSEYTTRKQPNNREKEKLKLDQMMKILFRLSKKINIQLINQLFGENFNSDEVEIHYGNSEFIKDDFNRISGDLFFSIRYKSRMYRYHVEFQTLNDNSMAIRMFQYGFDKAVELSATVNKTEPTIIEFPRQKVIFLEENARIPESLSFILRLPEGQEVPYTIPVMKYWEYTAEDLKERKMYALLPLQVFKSRKRIHSLYESKRTEKEKSRLITEEFVKLKDTIQNTVRIIGELHDEQEINTGDLERILRVIHNITEYLYKRYGEFLTIEKEARRMIKTLYDPRIKKQAFKEGIKEGVKKRNLEIAMRMLNDGMEPDKVAIFTELPVEDVRNLKLNKLDERI